jgi:zinc resistance-associated protein
MRKVLTIGGIVLLVAAIAIPVLAHGPGWGRGRHMMGYGQGGPGYCGQDRRGYENLTEGQRSQLDKLHQKFYDDTAQLRDEIRAKSAELDTILNSPNPDAERAKALQKEISDLRAKIAQNRINFELEERKITPEVRSGRGYSRGYGHHMGDYGSGMGYGHHMGGHGMGYGQHMGGYGPWGY